MSTSSTLVTRAQRAEQLKDFRNDFYDCLGGWADALFELTDAVLCAAGPVCSVPALSLGPTFRRSHGSIYKALSKGEVDQDQLRELLVRSRPTGWPLIFAVDASTWERSDAETSPERGFYHSASKHSAGQPIVAGWSFQWVSQLNFAPDSWTAPVDAMRVPPSADATTATVAQVRRVTKMLGADGAVAMFVFDAGYDPAGISWGLKDQRAQVLVRVRGDRVFFTDPPEHAGTAGRPRRHGHRFKLSDDKTAPGPDAEVRLEDLRYGKVRVRAWHNLHPRLHSRGRWAADSLPPIVRGSVVRVDVERLPKPSSRANNKTLWLWWSAGQPDLELCLHAYLHRFDIEHTYRFVKSTLGWTTPSLRTPEQADRWTWLIVGAYTQLRIARRRRRRPTVALGTTTRPRKAHPGPGPARVPFTSRSHWYARQTTEIPRTRPRAAQRHPPTAPHPLPGHQKDRLNNPMGD